MSTLSIDSPLVFVLAPFLAALAIALVGWLSATLRNVTTLLALLAVFVLALRWQAPASPVVVPIETLQVSGQRLTSTLRVDALSAFLLLIVATSALIIAAARDKFASETGRTRRSIALLLAIAAANGMLLAGDLLTLYGFAQLASLFLLLLLLAEPKLAIQRAGFKLFAAVEATGLALPLAIVLLVGSGASLDPTAIRSLAGIGIAGYALLVALATRAGIVPLHKWLSEVLENAPWLSAALVCALAAPLGSYCLLRLAYAFSNANLPVHETLLVLSIATILVGSYAALRHLEIGPIVAALALVQGGFLALALAAGGVVGTQAALSQFAYTILFAPAPFIVLSALLDRADSAAPFALPKAIAHRPFGGVVLAAALLAAAGMPPFYGFFARAYILQALLSRGGIYLVGVFVTLLATAALFAAVAKLIVTTFASEEVLAVSRWWQDRPIAALPLCLLSLLMVTFAIAPFILQRWLIEPAIDTALGSHTAAALAGLSWNAPLGGSLILLSLFAGGWLFFTAGQLPFSDRPAKISGDLRVVVVAAEHLFEAARYLDPYNIAKVIIMTVGRFVAYAVGAVLNRLAT